MKIENMKFKLRLKQAKIRNMDIAECLKVNKNTVTKMVEEPGRYITLDEAFQIRDHYFPEMTIDVLFGEEQKVTGDADETVKMLLNKALNILQKK